MSAPERPRAGTAPGGSEQPSPFFSFLGLAFFPLFFGRGFWVRLVGFFSPTTLPPSPLTSKSKAAARRPGSGSPPPAEPRPSPHQHPAPAVPTPHPLGTWGRCHHLHAAGRASPRVLPHAALAHPTRVSLRRAGASARGQPGARVPRVHAPRPGRTGTGVRGNTCEFKTRVHRRRMPRGIAARSSPCSAQARQAGTGEGLPAPGSPGCRAAGSALILASPPRAPVASTRGCLGNRCPQCGLHGCRIPGWVGAKQGRQRGWASTPAPTSKRASGQESLVASLLSSPDGHSRVHGGGRGGEG